MAVYLGAASDGHVYHHARVLGLTKPLLALNSDTLVTAYNPETKANWDVPGIKNDPLWKARGNPDEDGQTNGYEFVKLRSGEPLGPDNFQLTDVPANDFELVARWFRSRLPANDGVGLSETWGYREGVTLQTSPIGTLPDSNPDKDGNFAAMNATHWITYYIAEHMAWYAAWRYTYIDSEPPAEPFIVNQFRTNTKVGRTNKATPFYEYPIDAPVLALVDPQHLEAGNIDWIRIVA